MANNRNGIISNHDASFYARKDDYIAVPMSHELKAQVKAYADAHGLKMAAAIRIILINFFGPSLQKKQGELPESED